ncbi:MAG: hypothetical protein NTX49_06590 [Chlamydiae bacterium]|nr:hypothetical protein [Chlamydiota bacterium]
MKKILFFLAMLILSATGFADNVVINNQTSHPSKKLQSRMAVQWASTAQAVDDANKAMMCGKPLDMSQVQTIDKSGKITLTIPKDAEHLRLLVWTKSSVEPDLVTNWVDIVPNKTYMIKTDQLVPVVLMPGSGC